MIKLLLFAWMICHPGYNSYKTSGLPENDISVGTAMLQNPILGRWEGKSWTSSEETRVILDLNIENGQLRAEITLLDMGVMGWPSRSAVIEEGLLTLIFPTDNSQQRISLILMEDREGVEQLKGEWQDSNLEELAEVELYRSEFPSKFGSEQLEINGPAGKLSAELILPRGDGPFPGVVFLHGSGPQPKDANRFAAYELANQGIASVIFDKRGVGNSEGEWQGADFEDLAQDGIAAAKYLLDHDKVSHIGFFGHSQGGWIGPLAASLWEETTFVISSAGPAVGPAREAHWGFIHNARNAGAKEEDITLIRKTVEDWHEGLRSANWEPYKETVAQAETRSWFNASGLQYLQYPPDPAHLKYYLPFMDYDPIPALQSLDVPLLSILAPDDESIDSLETEAILLELANEGKDIRIIRYPGFNHGFRRIGTPPLRWPGFPRDYFDQQVNFISSVRPTNPGK